MPSAGWSRLPVAVDRRTASFFGASNHADRGEHDQGDDVPSIAARITALPGEGFTRLKDGFPQVRSLASGDVLRMCVSPRLFIRNNRRFKVPAAKRFGHRCGTSASASTTLARISGSALSFPARPKRPPRGALAFACATRLLHQLLRWSFARYFAISTSAISIERISNAVPLSRPLARRSSRSDRILSTLKNLPIRWRDDPFANPRDDCFFGRAANELLRFVRPSRALGFYADPSLATPSIVFFPEAGLGTMTRGLMLV